MPWRPLEVHRGAHQRNEHGAYVAGSQVGVQRPRAVLKRQQALEE